jgi:tetratricopeptide (TPR) repeat protein
MRKVVLFILCFAAVPVASQAQGVRAVRAAVVAIPIEDPADSLFRLGKQAVSDNDYRRAALLFSQVVNKYPKANVMPDALYWRAWALYHIGADQHSKGDLDEALASIETLQKSYAKSSAATTDAVSLRAQIRSAQASLGDARAATDMATEAKGLTQAKSCTGSKTDEEMRIAALDGLMSMNADDAIPILKDVLKQRDPCRIELRKKAVWLLSQKRAPDAVSVLLDVARSDPSTEVRNEAIFWLGSSHSAAAVTALDSVLFSGADDEVRKNAIFALSQQKQDERARAAIRRAAEDERLSRDVRNDAIFYLGQAGIADLDYFKTLFRKTKDIELKKNIVFAVSQTRLPGASAWLLEMARDKSADIEVRKDAVFQAGQSKMIDFAQLAALYDDFKGDAEMQDQIMFVLSQRKEPAAVDKLMDIARNDSNVERRKQALFWLGQKNDPRVKQFIRDIVLKPDSL